MDKFSRVLLATTCLTVASGAATASTITEGTSPAPADFPNTFPGYALPVGTDVVFGTANGQSDQDWFEFQYLLPNSSYHLSAAYNPLGAEQGLAVYIYNSSQVLLAAHTLEGPGASLNGTVPSDGLLNVEVFHSPLNVIGTTTGPYKVSLNAELAPEPMTLTTAGLALAGALAWRRKRRN